MNRVILFGNVGSDPVLRELPNGGQVLNFQLATERVWKVDGVTRKATEWHRIAVWGKRAKALSELVRRGAKLLVEGELRRRTWTTEDGTERDAAEVVASNVELGPKPREV